MCGLGSVVACCTVCVSLQEVACLKAELQILESRLKSPVLIKNKGANVKDRERCVL